MQFLLAISLLATCATQGVLTAPTGSNGQEDFDLVETADRFVASLLLADESSFTVPEEVKPTPLQPEFDEERNKEPVTGGATFDLLEPPPIFDPAEPRPQGIFVTANGLVRDELPKPPPISFTRPEHLSAFDAGNQPKDTPYPPDFSELEHDPSFYPCPMWQTLFKMSAAMLFLLFAAIACTMLIERMLSSLWRRMSGRRSSQPRGILEAAALLEEKRLRPRSDSGRSSIWSRSQSPPKISLA